MKVQVKDVSGNAIVDAQVTFTAPFSGASANFAVGGAASPSAVIKTDASGFADRTRPYREQPAWQLQRHRFGYDLSGVTVIATATPFGLTNNVPVGSTMTPSGTPQSIPTLGVFAPLQVTVKDASNNPIVGAGVKFQVNTSGSDYTQIATATFGGCTSGGCTVTIVTHRERCRNGAQPYRQPSWGQLYGNCVDRQPDRKFRPTHRRHDDRECGNATKLRGLHFSDQLAGSRQGFTTTA